MRKNIKLFLVLFATGVATVTIGHGCTPGGILGEDSSVATVQETENGIKPNQKTVSLVQSNQIVDHYVSCLGTGKASDQTMAVFNAKAGAISEFGNVDTITAPMMMALSSIAGEFCSDLINQESALAINSRRIFSGINFPAASLPSDAMMTDAMRRLARSCWGRNESDSEKQTLMSAISSAFPSGTANLTGRNAMLFMCTSMLSSVDALTL